MSAGPFAINILLIWLAGETECQRGASRFRIIQLQRMMVLLKK